MPDATEVKEAKKRKSGIPTGNAGEYLVMGELLRRGFDAQLADRNTRGYDLLAGRSEENELQKIQVKTVRLQPWYIKVENFQGIRLDQITIYVLIGPINEKKAARFFITRHKDLADKFHCPPNWKSNGFMKYSSVRKYENRWDMIG